MENKPKIETTISGVSFVTDVNYSEKMIDQLIKLTNKNMIEWTDTECEREGKMCPIYFGNIKDYNVKVIIYRSFSQQVTFIDSNINRAFCTINCNRQLFNKLNFVIGKFCTDNNTLKIIRFMGINNNTNFNPSSKYESIEIGTRIDKIVIMDSQGNK